MTIFGCPLELPESTVDAELKRYGKIYGRRLHTKEVDGFRYQTGLRIYKMDVEMLIPRFITISGHRVKTLYTGQDDELRQQRNRQTSQEQTEEYERTATLDHKRRACTILLEDGGGEEGFTEVRSVIHPDQPAEVKTNFEKDFQTLHNRIAEAGQNFAIVEFKDPPPPVVEHGIGPKKEKKVCAKIDAPSLAAIVESVYHQLPTHCFDNEFSIYHARAYGLYCQFGFADDIDMKSVQNDAYNTKVVTEWRKWSRENRNMNEEFSVDGIDKYITASIKRCLDKVYYLLPQNI